MNDEEKQCLQEIHDRLASASYETLKKEYKSLCNEVRMQDWYSTAAFTVQTPHTKRKNRYSDVLPFEHSRVRISDDDDKYINASFIGGGSWMTTTPERYIACMAPLPSTFNDFWSMIWKYDVKVILMLTRCVEKGFAKADQYWGEAPGDEIQCEDDTNGGTFRITLKTEKENSLGFITRELSISNGTATQLITQIQLTCWPDHGVLEDFSVVTSMLKLVNDFRKSSPVLVHCSAGIGRSGTFIAIDIIANHVSEIIEGQQSLSTKTQLLQKCFDIKSLAIHLRSQRYGAIQTADQYVMIHQYALQLLKTLL